MADSYRIYLDVPYSDVAAARQRGARFDRDKRLWYTTRPDHPATRHWSAVDPDARYYLDVPSRRSEVNQARTLGARWDKEAQRWYTLRPDHPALERWPEPKIRADLRAGHQHALNRLEQVHASGDDAPHLFPDGPSRLAIDPEVGARPRPDAFSPVNIPTVRQMLNLSEMAHSQNWAEEWHVRVPGTVISWNPNDVPQGAIREERAFPSQDVAEANALETWRAGWGLADHVEATCHVERVYIYDASDPEAQTRYAEWDATSRQPGDLSIGVNAIEPGVSQEGPATKRPRDAAWIEPNRQQWDLEDLRPKLKVEHDADPQLARESGHQTNVRTPSDPGSKDKENPKPKAPEARNDTVETVSGLGADNGTVGQLERKLFGVAPLPAGGWLMFREEPGVSKSQATRANDAERLDDETVRAQWVSQTVYSRADRAQEAALHAGASYVTTYGPRVSRYVVGEWAAEKWLDEPEKALRALRSPGSQGATNLLREVPDHEWGRVFPPPSQDKGEPFPRVVHVSPLGNGRIVAWHEENFDKRPTIAVTHDEPHKGRQLIFTGESTPEIRERFAQSRWAQGRQLEWSDLPKDLENTVGERHPDAPDARVWRVGLVHRGDTSIVMAWSPDPQDPERVTFYRGAQDGVFVSSHPDPRQAMSQAREMLGQTVATVPTVASFTVRKQAQEILQSAGVPGPRTPEPSETVDNPPPAAGIRFAPRDRAPTHRRLPPQTAKTVVAAAPLTDPEVTDRFRRLRNTLLEASTDPVLGHVRLPSGQESGEYFWEARERVDMAIDRLQANDNPRPSAQRRAASPSDDVLLPTQRTLSHLYRQSQRTPLEGLSVGEKPVTYGEAREIREDLRSTIDYTRHLAGSLQERLRAVPTATIKAPVASPAPAPETVRPVEPTPTPSVRTPSPTLQGPTLRGPHL